MTDTHEIASGRLRATIRAQGGEIIALSDANGPLLWHGGPDWPRHAPVLFPMVRARLQAVNGKPVYIPSYLVSAGDVIAVREKSRNQVRVQEALQLAGQVGFPSWVEVDANKAEGVFKKAPDRDEFGADINESLIVELYSR